MKNLFILLLSLIALNSNAQFQLEVDLTYKLPKDSSVVGNITIYQDSTKHDFIYFFNNFRLDLELNKAYVIEIKTETDKELWYINTTVPDEYQNYRIIYEFKCNLADNDSLCVFAYNQNKLHFTYNCN